MISVLAQMGLLILCGVAWGIIRPGGVDADQTRNLLTSLVFNLLMPALVLSVLWHTPLGLDTLKIAAFGAAIILFATALTWLISRPFRIERHKLGAAMLAVAFPNVTYLGLPVLEQTFGPWSRAIVIQIDLFASMPMVLTLGVWTARHYGEAPATAQEMPLRALIRNPPLWSALLALALNIGDVTSPPWLESALDRLAAGTIPLMLIALGLGLHWDAWHWRNLPLGITVLVCRLAAVPLFGLMFATELLGLSGDTLAALVMEAGMPAMLLGVVYCDRYRLDTAFYSMTVVLTTSFGMLSLPFWHGLLTNH